jgi:hypothetical protein
VSLWNGSQVSWGSLALAAVRRSRPRIPVVADRSAPADDLATLRAVRPVARDERRALSADTCAEAGDLVVPHDELRLASRPSLIRAAAVIRQHIDHERRDAADVHEAARHELVSDMVNRLPTSPPLTLSSG